MTEPPSLRNRHCELGTPEDHFMVAVEIIRQPVPKDRKRASLVLHRDPVRGGAICWIHGLGRLLCKDAVSGQSAPLHLSINLGWHRVLLPIYVVDWRTHRLAEKGTADLKQVSAPAAFTIQCVSY